MPNGLPTPLRPPADAAQTPMEDEHRLDAVWTQSDAADRIVALEADLARSREDVRRARGEANRMLATAAHEIRTPIGAIVGISDLLLSDPLTPAQTTYVQAIQTSGRALMALVDDVLDMSRMEADRLEVAAEPVALLKLLEDVVELVAPRAHGKGIAISLTLETALPARVELDPGRLRQVLLNLIGNAVKFTDHGGVDLNVATSPIDEHRARLTFSVSDTGPGIGTAERDAIFQAFVQGRAGRDPRHGGIGLGLSISQTILSAMDSRIHVDSEPGVGSRFSFRLDVPVLDATPVPSLEPLGGHVLVVAGQDSDRQALEAALRVLGVRVSAAGDAAATRTLLQTNRFDAVLVDHSGGLDAGQFVSMAQRTPIVAVVTPMTRAQLPPLKRSGVALHLTKPVRHGSLDRLMRSVLTQTPLPGRLPPVRAIPSSCLAMNVLLVEDDPVSALLGTALLKRRGCRVFTVGSAEEALAAADVELFDLILIDINLPGMSGLEAMAALRAGRAGMVDRTRIIALTADASPALTAAVSRAGGDDCRIKPLDDRMLDDFARIFEAESGDAVPADWDEARS